MRKIIHIDMDAFYASVEQRDNPQLKGKAIAVGHAGQRGVVAASSYEARKFGIHSAMSSRKALEKYPKLIFVEPRMEVYAKVSAQIREIFFQYTNLVEPLSLDEAYLDVTVNKKYLPFAVTIAKQIKSKIKTELDLTASAGVSVNKFLAKIASDMKKPDGLFVITQDQVEKFVEGLAIEKFWGVGKVTHQKMNSLGIFNGADLKKFSQQDLVKHFGKMGLVYYQNARGIDEREVEPNKERKSVGAENTFITDTINMDELKSELVLVAKETWSRATKQNFQGRTITLKIKYQDFKQITRSKTLNDYVATYSTLIENAASLLEKTITPTQSKKIRLMGITISNNKDPEIEQLPLLL
jgi:DNA polymerase-4